MDKHCMGCVYYVTATHGWEHCAYILIRGKRRPCPPGKLCTEKKLWRRGKSSPKLGEKKT